MVSGVGETSHLICRNFLGGREKACLIDRMFEVNVDFSGSPLINH